MQRRETGGARVHTVLDVGDEQVQLVLDLVRYLVLGGQVQIERAIELTCLVQGQHLGSRRRVPRIDRAHALDALAHTRSADRLDPVEILGETVLRDLDLGVPRIVERGQGHRAVVALRRDGVDRLACEVALVAQLDLVVRSRVHLPDHDDARDPHRQQEHGDDQEPGQQLGVDRGADPRDPIDRGSDQGWELVRVSIGGSEVIGCPVAWLVVGHVASGLLTVSAKPGFCREGRLSVNRPTRSRRCRPVRRCPSGARGGAPRSARPEPRRSSPRSPGSRLHRPAR